MFRTSWLALGLPGVVWVAMVAIAAYFGGRYQAYGGDRDLSRRQNWTFVVFAWILVMLGCYFWWQFINHGISPLYFPRAVLETLGVLLLLSAIVGFLLGRYHPGRKVVLPPLDDAI